MSAIVISENLLFRIKWLQHVLVFKTRIYLFFWEWVSSQRRLTFYYNINCPNVKDFRSWNCKIVKNELKFITNFAQIAQKICQNLGV